jgi:hypothetical protein
MAFARFSFGAVAFLGLGLAAACGSSSSGGGAANGGEPDGSTVISPTTDGGAPGLMATCGLLSGLGGGGAAGTCPAGQTCCTMIALPPSASCVPSGSCTGISNECMSGSDCASGQVCCAGAADGGAMLALDAAVMAGAAGIPMIDTSTLNTTCQASCTATQTQYCSISDAGIGSGCPSGQTCQQLGGGAAAALAGFITIPNVCTAPRPDAGESTPDSGSAGDDAGSNVPDSGGSVDAAQE